MTAFCVFLAGRQAGIVNLLGCLLEAAGKYATKNFKMLPERADGEERDVFEARANYLEAQVKCSPVAKSNNNNNKNNNKNEQQLSQSNPAK